MTKFLNTNMDNRVNKNHLLKHIQFSLFWIVGISILLFRIDLFFVISPSLDWLKVSIPFIYIICLLVWFLKQKWYYKLAFMFYPILMIFWFIPKTILKTGKIYIFMNYLIAILTRLINYKLTLFNAMLFFFSFIFFISIDANWTRWFIIICFSYFYLIYVYRIVKKSFKTQSLFDEELEEKIQNLKDKITPENSFIIKSIINRKDDEKLEISERREKQMKRSILVNYAIEYITSKLNRFKERKALVMLWVFIGGSFLIISLIYFWFLNIQLYKIDPTNFIYSGSIPYFDFFYYTIKTTTLTSIDLIKPVSVVARISEMSSYVILGILILIFFVPVLLSLRKSNIKKNIKLTIQLIEIENLTLNKYFVNKYGVEIQSAMKEVKDIDVSIKNLRDIINSIL